MLDDVYSWLDLESPRSELTLGGNRLVRTLKTTNHDGPCPAKCPVVAPVGYYEWPTESKLKQPYHIHFPDRKPFAFAGLWERWEDEEGKTVETCTVITTAANKAMEAVHDRMPVILAKVDFPRWLDHRLK